MHTKRTSFKLLAACALGVVVSEVIGPIVGCGIAARSDGRAA